MLHFRKFTIIHTGRTQLVFLTSPPQADSCRGVVLHHGENGAAGKCSARTKLQSKQAQDESNVSNVWRHQHPVRKHDKKRFSFLWGGEGNTRDEAEMTACLDARHLCTPAFRNTQTHVVFHTLNNAHVCLSSPTDKHVPLTYIPVWGKTRCSTSHVTRLQPQGDKMFSNYPRTTHSQDLLHGGVWFNPLRSEDYVHIFTSWFQSSYPRTKQSLENILQSNPIYPHLSFTNNNTIQYM